MAAPDRRADLEDAGPPGQAPEGEGRIVAEEGAGPAGEHGGHRTAVGVAGDMAQGVDAGVDGDQVAAADVPVDPRDGVPCLVQLGAGDVAQLALGDLDDFLRIPRFFAHFP